MSKFFYIEEELIKSVNLLFRNKFDGQFVILSKGARFSDIAQWSDKYNNVRIVTVPNDKLDFRFALN